MLGRIFLKGRRLQFYSMSKAKMVLVGSAHAGKTSIINKYIYGEFTPHTMPSTQPAFFQKNVYYNGTETQLEIWDTAGQEQYHALSPMFYRDAEVGLVVFDLTDSSSFSKSKQWVNELRQARGDNITIALVGNKLDLASLRTVSLEAMNQFASSIGADAFETSAKTGQNIDLVFQSVVKKLSTGSKAVMTTKTKAGHRSSVKFDEPPKESGCSC